MKRKVFYLLFLIVVIILFTWTVSVKTSLASEENSKSDCLGFVVLKSYLKMLQQQPVTAITQRIIKVTDWIRLKSYKSQNVPILVSITTICPIFIQRVE